LLSAAAAKRICESEVFAEVVHDCVIEQFVVRRAVELWAWMAMAMALLAWLAAIYWSPSPDMHLVKFAEYTVGFLLVWSSYSLYMALGCAVDFLKAQLNERRLMEEGKETFGGDFAVAVQACRDRLSALDDV
jgi:hypothetical protein